MEAFADLFFSVPVQKWDDGLFDISPDDDQRIEDITLDHSTDLSDPEVQSFIKGMILVERKKEGHAHAGGLKRHCKTCQIYKPDRTHHCKVCGHCVLRMDHHCPWVASQFHAREYTPAALLMLMRCSLRACVSLCCQTVSDFVTTNISFSFSSTLFSSPSGCSVRCCNVFDKCSNQY